MFNTKPKLSNIQLAVAEKLQNEGKACYRKGQYETAVDKFTEVGELLPQWMTATRERF